MDLSKVKRCSFRPTSRSDAEEDQVLQREEGCVSYARKEQRIRPMVHSGSATREAGPQERMREPPHSL